MALSQLTSCPFRSHLPGSDKLRCNFIAHWTGLYDADEIVVNDKTCHACARTRSGSGSLNAVTAWLAHQAATKVIEHGGKAGCSLAAAQRVAALAAENLDTAFNRRTDCQGLTSETIQTRFAVAMLTAPRDLPCIQESIKQIESAGFKRFRIYAEPNAWVPPDFDQRRLIRRAQRLGNLSNFYDCLSHLLIDYPTADAYIVFQDDVHLSDGLAAWFGDQMWPHNCGIVSLFTPKIHSRVTAGWRLCSPGPERICGAQALAFRPTELRAFLADPLVLHHLSRGFWHDDAVLARWVADRGLAIAYHTPSPVQHVGTVSSIFVEGSDRRNVGYFEKCVERFSNWQLPPARPARVGLVGWNTQTGLGSINRELVEQLRIQQWLCPVHPELPDVLERLPSHVKVSRDGSAAALKQWVKNIDWLIFAERPLVDDLPQIAAYAGVGLACIPMWEWLDPRMHWLQFMDLMLCPNRYCQQILDSWRSEFGFGYQTVLLPWPVNVARIPFQERRECREFLFVNGWGGGNARRPDGKRTSYSRKGLEVLIQAARLAPDLRFVIRSLARLPAPLPANIRVLRSVEDMAELYSQGDVCVLPSHYEGLGLQLLECQAAGMPLVTTDAPPMNETRALKLIPTSRCEAVEVTGHLFGAHLIDPRQLVETLREIAGADITSTSHSAREYIEQQHSWSNALSIFQRELVVR